MGGWVGDEIITCEIDHMVEVCILVISCRHYAGSIV